MPKHDRDQPEPNEAPRDPAGSLSGDDADAQSKFFPELLRRGLSLGFTGFFMTEEAIRRALGDSVPRDVVEFVLEQSERTRAELLDRFSKEFGKVLSAVDPVEISKRLLEGKTIEVSARVRLITEDEKDEETEPK
ncbi:MAG: hypothetical protein QNK05_12690 [Myxococcota bacterium]|nr:hypothetical protein [Myxococcota bacterium]